MQRLLTIILLVLTAATAQAQESEATTDPVPVLDIRPAGDLTPEQFQWLNRLIVVFADTDRDPVFQRQIELLFERPQDLIDRDVIVITDTDPDNPSAFRQQLRPRGFSFVFIDKDSVVKLRKPSPWSAREISRSIDKTDLRQDELRDAREAG